MLGRSSSSKKGMHVVWDEDNLKQNEEIQKEYSAVRISEPKTPYRPPLPSDSLEDDMKPLQLDEVASALRPAERMTAFDYVMSNGGAGYDGAGPSSQQQPQQQEQQQEQELEQQQHHQQPHPPSSAAGTSYASSVEADGDRVMEDVVGDKRSEPSTSFTSSGSEGSVDKRRRFMQMRKQHYNMRDALLKAKQLLSEDEEDVVGEQQQEGSDPEQGEQEEEDEEDDTANCQVGNGMSAGPSGSSRRTRQRQQHHSGAGQPPHGLQGAQPQDAATGQDS